MAGNRGPMTESMYYTLLSLKNKGQGMKLVDAVKAASAGRVEIGPGSLYGVLVRMEQEGLVVSEKNHEEKRRYRITQEGEAALENEYGRLMSMVRDGMILIKGDPYEKARL